MLKSSHQNASCFFIHLIFVYMTFVQMFVLTWLNSQCASSHSRASQEAIPCKYILHNVFIVRTIIVNKSGRQI